MTTYVVKDTPGTRWLEVVGCRAEFRTWLSHLPDGFLTPQQRRARLEILDGPFEGMSLWLWEDQIEEVEQ